MILPAFVRQCDDHIIIQLQGIDNQVSLSQFCKLNQQLLVQPKVRLFR